jgi:microcompartment protein CcmK/EutM
VQLGKVIGTVVSSVKDSNLVGLKLLVVQPLSPERTPIGRCLVAVDSVGAGVGEEIFFVRGREASFPFHPTQVPTDANIIGIVDSMDLEKGTDRSPA